MIVGLAPCCTASVAGASLQREAPGSAGGYLLSIWSDRVQPHLAYPIPGATQSSPMGRREDVPVEKGVD